MAIHSRRQFLVYSLLGLLSACGSSAVKNQEASAITLTLSVASSLQDAIQAIGEKYTQQTPNVKLVYNFGSSGSLQQQIEQGAPVDIFISASPKQMNALRDKNLLLADTEKPLLKNQVVLITPKQKTGISDFKQLTSDRVGKIAIGDPESVPAGQYAKEVLTTLELYESLKNKLVFAKNVRQVLTYVETGNVDAGIVYVTDAKLSDKVKVIATASDKTHSPIIYPVTVLKDSKNPDAAKAFVQFLFSQPAQDIFENYGFKMAS